MDPMQTICTSFGTDNHTNTSSLNFTDRMLFLTPVQTNSAKALKANQSTEN